jgi:soluble lytic murein transglycosylase-like protein
VRRTPLAVSLTVLAAVVPAAPAGAEVAHVVQPGETLWSIAAANNLTTRTVAAYNGLSEDGHVILGGTVKVPTVAEGAAALQSAGVTPAPAAAPVAAPAAPAADTTPTVTATATTTDAPAPLGSYTVRWGDTLAGLAATARVSVSQMASMNGLDASRPLLAGTVIKLPTGSPAPARASAPAPAKTVVPDASPTPTSTRVDCPQIQSVAAEHGVPGSLACAIGWQESGFNNGMVSPANARGVMQVMPGTWEWVQRNLSDRPLDASSASDNVRAGVLYLRQLLRETGGDEGSAIAGYYQGLSSVRSRGLYDDTKQYVGNVQALRSRFGG